MPWTAADVDRHKEGLTTQQKDVWVRVANGALARCNEKGGSDCEGSAIRQANSVISLNMSFEEWIKKDFGQIQTFNIFGREIFATGKWNGDTYTTKDLDQMVKAFGEVGFEPPLKLGHNHAQEKDLFKDGQPALGWIGKIYREGNKLLADFKEIPQKVYNALRRKNYKTVSAEIYWNYSNNGKTWPRVLRAVSLIGADIPAVTSLEDLDKLYQDNNNHEVRVYSIHIESFANDKKGGNMDKVEELETKVKELADKNAVLTKNNTNLEAQTKELSDTQVKLKEAQIKLAEGRAEVKAERIKVYISEKKKEGQVLPAFEKELTALLNSASDEKCFTFTNDKEKSEDLNQYETLKRFVDALPKMIEFSEVGDSNVDNEFTEGSLDNPGEEVDRRTKLYMSKKNIKDYGEAMAAVFVDDPELKEKYVVGGK